MSPIRPSFFLPIDPLLVQISISPTWTVVRDFSQSSLHLTLSYSYQCYKNHCCCSVAKSCLPLYDPMDCSMSTSLSFIFSWSLFKLMSTELVIPSNHLILCHFLLLLPSIFHSIRVFTTSGSQSIGASASASVLPVNIQGRFPLGLTGLISLLSKRI